MVKDRVEKALDCLVEVDDCVQTFFEPYANSAPPEVLEWVSKLGDQPALRIASAGLFLAGIMSERERMMRAGARMIIAHELATLAKDAVKMRIDRTRPRSAADGTTKKPRKGKRTAKEKTSFPSGHSAGAIAVARAFSREFPEYRVAAIGAATGIAGLQIARCAHYPSDVAAGLLLGLVAEAVTATAWDLAGMDQRSGG